VSSEKDMAEDRLPKTTIALHWILAASVFFLFVSSWWMLALPLPSDDFTYRVIPFQLHKNIGLSILIFIVVMLGTRILVRYRREKEEKQWKQSLTDFDHLLIYFLVFACCVSGYISSSYSGWGTEFWWLVQLPAWADENDDLNILFSDIHKWACWTLLALIALHISAALQHAIKNDGIINKMFRVD